MRARQGDDDSIFEVDWQDVNDPDVPSVPMPTAFASSHSDPFHEDFDQVGEVRQKHYEKAGTFLPDYLFGDTY